MWQKMIERINVSAAMLTVLAAMILSGCGSYGGHSPKEPPPPPPTDAGGASADDINR